MFPLRMTVLAASTAALLAACGGSDNDDGDGGGGHRPPPVLDVTKVEGRYHGNKGAQASGLKTLGASAQVPAAEITLPALDAEALLQKNLGTIGPVLVAKAQPVLQADSQDKLAALLQWHTGEQGQSLAAVRVHATDALGIRLGLVVDALPDAALLRVYHDASSEFAHETTGAEINALLQRNADAGDTSQAARTWWSPDLGGDSATLQIELPAGVAPEAVRLALPTISHGFVDASESVALAGSGDLQTLDFTGKNEQIPDAGSCNLDVTCYTNGEAQRDAVARMLFVNDGDGYWCTGTLLNDAIGSDIPYFLTANHCIASQTVASTLQTDWFFRTARCDASGLDPRRVTRSGGATLLFTNDVSQGQDMTLLALRDGAPEGTFLAGWDAGLNNTVQNVYGIHHPAGSLAKISGGEVENYANCDGSRCAGSDRGRYYEVIWGNGTTEGGSSGSALFTEPGYVIGTLHGGSASCRALDAPDFYGRLDMAFENGIKNFLAASERPF